MAVRIILLGPPRIERDGERIGFDTRKATALLAFLALAERPHSREALCDLLWPRNDPEHARGALRRTLSTIRGQAGSEALVVSGDTVALGAADVDVHRFRQHADAGDEAAAVAVFAGRPLEGFGLRDSADFDTWQRSQEEALHRELGATLSRLVDRLTAAGDHPPAIAHAQRWLSLDDLHEPAHRALIRLHALRGDRAASLSAYRDCVRVLSAELGVAPVEETARLFGEVSEGTLSSPAPPPPRAARAAAPGVLPLVGREAEVAALQAAQDADGGLVIVEGEAGIGKTRLVAELTGAGVLGARCYEAEAGLPYAAIADLLRQAAERELDVSPQHRADASLLAGELGGPDLPPPIGPDAPGAQARLFDAVAAVLTAAAEVVVVDDAHAADAATRDVLTYLAHRLNGRSLLLVLTWRSEAVAPGDPLRALARDATVLRPRRLVETEVAALAADADSAARLWSESEGLPLFVAEYLAAGGEAVAGARGLLEARLSGADAATRQIAGAAAVLRHGFDFDAIRDTSGRAEEEVLDALEELVARGILREQGDGYEFSHGKLRALVGEATGLARRRLLHRRAAATETDAALVADHLREAGDDAAAAERYAEAAEHAAQLFAHAEAVAHLGAALALGHPDPARLRERIGDALTLMGDYPGALGAYDAAAALSPSPGLEHKLGGVHLRRGEWPAAQARFGAALDDSPLRARVLADLALARHHSGDTSGAVDLAREAAGAASDPAAQAQAHNLLGMLIGDAAELERSLVLAEELGDRPAQAAALNNLALINDDPARALALTERALALCERGADRHREAALLNNLADLHHAAGRDEAAMAHLKRAVAIFAEVGADESTRLPGIWQLVSW